MIVKRGDKYAVTTADGSRILGKHSTQAEAEAQLRAIDASKAEGVLMTVDEIIRLMDHAKAIGCPHFKWDGVEFVIPRTKPQPVSKELPQRVPDEEVIP